MIEAFAIHTVHVCRTPAKLNAAGKVMKKPEIEVVQAGTVFAADEATVNELVARGAVRLPVVTDRLFLAADADHLTSVEVLAGQRFPERAHP